MPLHYDYKTLFCNYETSSIDVIIPVFNAESSIFNTLYSLKTQEDADFNVIVVDDCSTDASLLKIYRFIKHLRISILQTSCNCGGPAIPRNIGVKFSKAPYIAFLDADDLFFPSKISFVKNYLANGKLDCVALFHPLQITDKSCLSIATSDKRYSRLIGRLPYFFSLLDFESIVCHYSNPFANSGLIISRAFLIEQNAYDSSTSVIALEDYDIVVRLAHAKSKVVFINAILGAYYINPNSIQSPRRTIAGMRYITGKYPSGSLYLFPLKQTILASFTIFVSKYKSDGLVMQCLTSLVFLLLRSVLSAATFMVCCVDSLGKRIRGVSCKIIF